MPVASLPCPPCRFLPGRCCVEVPPQHAPPLLLLQAPEVLLQGEQAVLVVTVAVGAHAIDGAVLTVRALHVDSQQQLGLVPAAGGAAAAQPADAGAGVPLGGLAAGQQVQVVLLLDARYSGAVDVSAELRVGGLSTCSSSAWPGLSV